MLLTKQKTNKMQVHPPTVNQRTPDAADVQAALLPVCSGSDVNLIEKAPLFCQKNLWLPQLAAEKQRTFKKGCFERDFTLFNSVFVRLWTPQNC
jgi:hypothetical protein